MLDDLKIFHEKDTADTLGATEHQPEQLERAFDLKGSTDFSAIQNVVFAAMGGSAIAATFVQGWTVIARPFEIVRGYDIPAYVSKDTLVIVASSSGNTEETLSALAQAEEKGARIAVITGGGNLQQIAEEKGYLLANLPGIPFPRFNAFTNLRALTQILEIAGMLGEGHVSELESAVKFLGESCGDFRPDVPTAKNRAKQIAQELLGRSIVLYGGPKTYPVAYKWKVGFNENAKQIAWTGQYPEFNHNEFSGWSKQPVDKPYAVIELHSSFENPRVQKRFKISERLLSGMRPAPLVVDLEGDTLLKQLLWGAMLGEYVSLYLAFASGVNPVPLPLVDKLKAALVA